ncbi:MAG: ubiquinol-cytochrome c reductase cytochrome b subunit, partial [Actinomycetota bacterium]|nr:ubiquinol-cytochrome c reductase cytochrome b subunit [Actinomycetota bacterium]
MLKRLAAWIDDRLGAAAFAEEALNKVFPDHWAFLLGEIAMYCFVVLLATGVFLTFFFDASTAKTVYSGHYAPLNGSQVSSAYSSVMHLSFDIRMGLVIRQIHHWAAVVFIAAIVAHLCRIFFTSAFRRPREINWVLGMTLMILSIFNGFTGYSLPDDLLSGVGLRIAYSIAIS